MKPLKNSTFIEAYAPGKLLITGEYMVLKGAIAFAVPLKKGQRLKMVINETGKITWETILKGKAFFTASFNHENLKVLSTSDAKKANYISTLLKAVKKLNPDFFLVSGLHFISEPEFSLDWGLGNSSAMIVNLARLSGTDAMKIHQLTSMGSGYDVACAQTALPILYSVNGEPGYEPVEFNPPFKDQLFLVYLGNKQDSNESVRNFIFNSHISGDDIILTSQLSIKAPQCTSATEFADILNTLQQITARILGVKTLAETRFPDLKGTIKPLGAWGGDFALIITTLSKDELANYLHTKGIDILFTWKELVG